MVTTQKQLLIKRSRNTYRISSHKILKDNHHKNISYGELRFALASQKLNGLKKS
ncbi:MAG: hypothetical protein ABIN97_19130 [Ginsengibacter sp.]